MANSIALRRGNKALITPPTQQVAARPITRRAAGPVGYEVTHLYLASPSAELAEPFLSLCLQRREPLHTVAALRKGRTSKSLSRLKKLLVERLAVA